MAFSNYPIFVSGDDKKFPLETIKSPDAQKQIALVCAIINPPECSLVIRKPRLSHVAHSRNFFCPTANSASFMFRPNVEVTGAAQLYRAASVLTAALA